MILLGDRVPMYRMRANRGLLWVAVFVLIVGGLLAAYFFNEDAYSSSTRGLFTVIVTCILTVFLIIAATAHFWFAHLWHHRPGYKRG